MNRAVWAARAIHAICIGWLASSVHAQPATPLAVPPGLYDLDAQTSMPHLEEGLRASGTREQRCLDEAQLATLFPLLRHPSLAGCVLLPVPRSDGARGFWLRCDNPAAASGSARIEIEGDRLAGALDLKMGGKNMTLTQRVQGLRRSACP